jgi:zinc protease
VAADLAQAVTPVAAVDKTPVQPPVLRTLRGGIPVIVQASDLSANAQLRIVLPGNRIVAAGTTVAADEPATGYSSLSYRVGKGQLAAILEKAREDVAKATREKTEAPTPSADPATRLEQVFGEFMGGARQTDGRQLTPALIALSGDIDNAAATALLESRFGLLAPASLQPATVSDIEARDLTVNLGKSVAQAQLGYIVAAPGPRDGQADAARLLLYILSHDYEGRLGKKAISDRGLAYYIDSRYRADGNNGWITMSVGVDPGKIAALRELLAAELRRLVTEPPTDAEINEAKNHWLGRAQSAAQTNEELTGSNARQWLWYGELPAADTLDKRMAAITRQDVLNSIDAFISGMTVVVQK